MRKNFSEWIEKTAAGRPDILFITGDLGFAALENVKAALDTRFINAGVSEQNMIGMSASLAHEGFTVFCYSIAPFAVFRPLEQTRVDVCLHNKNVKIVGNGGGYGYGIMGATHHAREDLAVMSCLPNLRCYIPYCNQDVAGAADAMLSYRGPSYLRLAYGELPAGRELPAYQALRRISKEPPLERGVTVVSCGPVALNCLQAAEGLKAESGSALCEIFAVSEFPVKELGGELRESLARTRRLLVVEEHVARGGLGEALSYLLLQECMSPRFRHLFARGYPGGGYGGQAYHQRMSGLDPAGVQEAVKELMRAG